MSDPQNDADDIGADLKAAFDQSRGDVAPVTDTPVAAAVEQTAPKPEVIVDDAGRVRGPDGKFAKVEETNTAAPAAAAPDKNQPKPAAVEPQAAQTQPETIQPPASWSPQAKAAFMAAPADVQKELLRNVEDMNKGKQTWETKAESFNRLDKVIAPHRQRLALQGISEDQYVGTLFAAEQALAQNPYQAIAQLAKNYGVDLTRFSQPNTQQPQPGQPQGQPQQVPPIVQQLVQQVQTLQQNLTQRDQAETDSRRTATLSEIDRFRTDPAHLYFENVKPELVAIVRNGDLSGDKRPIQERLKEAYEQACWANAQVRPLILAEAEKKRAAELKAKVSDARNAAVSVTGVPGSGQSVRYGSPNDDLDADIREAVAAHR